MDVLQAIRGRRSIRGYRSDRIPRETLLGLVEAAIWAPSGGNAQTWRFVILQDAGNVAKMRALSPGAIGKPAAFVVVCQDRRLAEKPNGGVGRDLLSVMDVAMASQNLMLAAFSEGIGSCAVGGFDRSGVRKLLRLPAKVAPELAIMLGYPATNPDPPQRRTSGVVFFECFDEDNEA